MSTTQICRCGTDIGSLSDAYNVIWEHVKKVHSDKRLATITSDSIGSTTKPTISAGPILDALGLVNSCCRMNMMSDVNPEKLKNMKIG
jgi:DNA-directed RNA polymerase subunit N (RpoN/RPB10)